MNAATPHIPTLPTIGTIDWTTGQRHPATPTSQSKRANRDVGLDTARTLALSRVFLWHATGYAALTWIAALPVMFHITGMLTAASITRTGIRTTLRNRLRRLLIPLWLYAAAAFATLTWAHQTGRTPDAPAWEHLWTWIVPLVDPIGHPWENGWLSRPLWYLRVLLWLYLLTPALHKLGRRSWHIIPGLISTMTIIELTTNNRWWQLQELLLFAVFYIAGYATTTRAPRPEPTPHTTGNIAPHTVALHPVALHPVTAKHRKALADTHRRNVTMLAVAAAAGAAAMAAWRWPQDGTVNNSPTLHLLVGTFWVCTTILNRERLSRIGTMTAFNPVVKTMSARAMTIYLWHSAALAIAWYAIVPQWGHPNQTIQTLAATLAGISLTVLACGLFGRIEDLAARKAPRTTPKLRTQLISAALVTTFLAGTIPGETNSTVYIPAPPSQAPGPATFTEPPPNITLPNNTPKPAPGTGNTAGTGQGTNQETETTTDQQPARWETTTPQADTELSATYTNIIDRWVAAHNPGTYVITIARPGDHQFSATSNTPVEPDPLASPTGEKQTGTPRTEHSEFRWHSITKTFTAVLTLRAWEEGLLNLDEPVGTLKQTPWFTRHGQTTPRQLLAHRSGLAHHMLTQEAIDDPTIVKTPEDALRIVQDEPLTNEPGTKSEYSSANYIILGLLLEQIYDKPIEQQLLELAQELNLTTVTVDQPSPGYPATGTGGIRGSMQDLTRWIDALWRNKTVLTPASYDVLMTVDTDTMLGTGSFAWCPCWKTETGPPGIAGYGAQGGTTTARYYWTHDLLITAYLPTSMFEAATTEMLNELLEASQPDNQTTTRNPTL